MPDQSRPELITQLPDYVRKYYETNDVRMFTFSRPFKKQKTGNEFLDLWTFKSTFETVEGCV